MPEPVEASAVSPHRTKHFRIEAYAIISSDGMIADANGAFPAVLSFEADKKYYERELDRVDAIVMGRHSYEYQTNSANRRRLVLTRKIAGLAPDSEFAHCFQWNPLGASLDDACGALGLKTGLLGIIGGTAVFDLFLAIGYDVFHLSRADKVTLPGGAPVFSQIRADRSPEDVLVLSGLQPGPTEILDPANAITQVDWTPKAPA
jgi:dihydrofolate reductase